MNSTFSHASPLHSSRVKLRQKLLNRSLPENLNRTSPHQQERPLNLGLPKHVADRPRLTEDSSDENILTSNYDVMSESFLAMEKEIAAEAQRGRKNAPIAKLIHN